MINSFWVSNGNIYINVPENAPVMPVAHAGDLEKNFDINKSVREVEA